MIQMKQKTQVARRSWLDCQSGKMQEKAEGQMGIEETYQIMTGMSEDENMEEIRAPEV